MDVTELDDLALDALLVAALAERARRRTISEARTALDALVQRWEAATATGEPIPWAELGDRVGPGQRVIWTDGHVWRNTSGTWLPVSAPPAAYPLGWSQLTGLPDSVPPFVAGEQVKAGYLRSYEGVIYRCVQAHTTAAHWPPPAVPALWARQEA